MHLQLMHRARAKARLRRSDESVVNAAIDGRWWEEPFGMAISVIVFISICCLTFVLAHDDTVDFHIHGAHPSKMPVAIVIDGDYVELDDRSPEVGTTTQIGDAGTVPNGQADRALLPGIIDVASDGHNLSTTTSPQLHATLPAMDIEIDRPLEQAPEDNPYDERGKARKEMVLGLVLPTAIMLLVVAVFCVIVNICRHKKVNCKCGECFSMLCLKLSHYLPDKRYSHLPPWGASSDPIDVPLRSVPQSIPTPGSPWDPNNPDAIPNSYVQLTMDMSTPEHLALRDPMIPEPSPQASIAPLLLLDAYGNEISTLLFTNVADEIWFSGNPVPSTFEPSENGPPPGGPPPYLS